MTLQLGLPGTFVVPPCFVLPASAPPPGALVGAGRWPYVGSHPDCWMRPWQGEVLALDDPRAWRGTLAFPCCNNKLPDVELVREHLWNIEHRYASDMEDHGCRELLRQQYLNTQEHRIPVLWDFDGELVAMWERVARHDLDVHGVKPYGLDLALWKKELAHARRAYGMDHKASREVV